MVHDYSTMPGYSLMLEPYCEGCPGFSAESRTKELRGDDQVIVSETRIGCEHQSMCQHLYRYIRKQYCLEQKKEAEKDESERP